MHYTGLVVALGLVIQRNPYRFGVVEAGFLC